MFRAMLVQLAYDLLVHENVPSTIVKYLSVFILVVSMGAGCEFPRFL